MKQHYAGLDGIRGLAAGAVMLMHLIGIFRPGLGPQINASVAVDLFFMLSGFVLVRAYERKLKAGLTAGQFMEMRLIRLYPMFILGAAIGLFYAAGQALLHRCTPRTPAFPAFRRPSPARSSPLRRRR